MQDVVNDLSVLVTILASISVLARLLVKRLTDHLNIIELDILVHVGISKSVTSAVKRSIRGSFATVGYIGGVDELFLILIVGSLSAPTDVQHSAGGGNIDVSLIEQTATLGSIHVAHPYVITISIGDHNFAGEQELRACLQIVGGSKRVNRSGQRVGSHGHLTVGHAVHNGDGLDGHRLVNGNRTFIGSAALGGLATINGVVDGGTLDGRNGYRLDGVVLTSPRIDHRCLHLMNNLRDAEGLVGGIDGDGVFTSLGELDDRIFVMTRNIRGIQVKIV